MQGTRSPRRPRSFASRCLERGVEPLRVGAMGQATAVSRRLPCPCCSPAPGQVRADLLVDDFTKLLFRTRIEVAR
jgi:hypothetical protein